MLMCFDSVILNRRIHSEEIIQNKERNVYTDVCGSTICMRVLSHFLNCVRPQEAPPSRPLTSHCYKNYTTQPSQTVRSLRKCSVLVECVANTVK